VGVGVWIQENRDPRKLSPLLDLLLDNPLSGDGGSAADSGSVQFCSIKYINIYINKVYK